MRNKKILILFPVIVVLFISGCKKDPVVDYRKAFTGSYALTIHKFGGYGTPSSFTGFDTTYSSTGNVSYGSEKSNVIILFDTGNSSDGSWEVVVSEDGNFTQLNSGHNNVSGHFSAQLHTLDFHSQASSPASSTRFDVQGYVLK